MIDKIVSPITSSEKTSLETSFVKRKGYMSVTQRGLKRRLPAFFALQNICRLYFAARVVCYKQSAPRDQLINLIFPRCAIIRFIAKQHLQLATHDVFLVACGLGNPFIACPHREVQSKGQLERLNL